MATVSVSVPDELKQNMEKLDEVNWSAVARHAFEERMRQIALVKRLAQKSALTEKDAREISRRISEGIAKRFREME